MPSGEGQPSPAPSKRLNVSRTVEAAMPSRRAISRVEIPAENFKRMISRTWRIATLSAGMASSLPWIAKGGTLNRPAEALVAIPDPGRHYSVPVGGIISLWWAASFRYGGRHHLVMMGGLDRNQQTLLSDKFFRSIWRINWSCTESKWASVFWRVAMAAAKAR